MELTLEKMYRITHKLMYCLKMFVYNRKYSRNIRSRKMYNYSERTRVCVPIISKGKYVLYRMSEKKYFVSCGWMVFFSRCVGM